MLQHKVACVGQYKLISRASNDDVALDGLLDFSADSIEATVHWSQHAALLHEPPLDVIATLVIVTCVDEMKQMTP